MYKSNSATAQTIEKLLERTHLVEVYVPSLDSYVTITKKALRASLTDQTNSEVTWKRGVLSIG